MPAHRQPGRPCIKTAKRLFCSGDRTTLTMSGQEEEMRGLQIWGRIQQAHFPGKGISPPEYTSLPATGQPSGQLKKLCKEQREGPVTTFRPQYPQLFALSSRMGTRVFGVRGSFTSKILEISGKGDDSKFKTKLNTQLICVHFTIKIK